MLVNDTSAIEFDRGKSRPRRSWSTRSNAPSRTLRVSVTDRCDFRCVYCMSEHMTFLPKADLLSLEELDRLCSAFVEKGVNKLRLTGGEPLVRRGIMTLVSSPLSPSCQRRAQGIDADHQWFAAAEICSGTERRMASSGSIFHSTPSMRINFVPSRVGVILTNVMAGIDAAQAQGLAIKINAVALKGVNEDEIVNLLEWAHGRGMDLTVIEVMPLGDVDESRLDQYLPLSIVRARLAERFTLEDIDYRTGGPARYVRVKETGGRLGFITPLTHNFCESCNRVRITCTGTLYMCLGQNDAADLRESIAGVREQRIPLFRDRRGNCAQAERP